MPCVRERKPGKWKAEVQVGETRVAKTFPTRDQAEAWATDKAARFKARDELATAMANKVLMARMPRRVLEACSKVPYTHDEIVRCPIPANVMSGVYFLIRDGEVCYVGQSVDVLHRVARHRREGRLFDSFNVLPCGKEDMDTLENLYITALMPSENSFIRSEPQSANEVIR